jgi:thiamine biosynthesis lipoprotein
VLRSLLALILPVVALIGALPPELRRFDAVEPHMGTLVRITIFTPDEQAARDAFRVAFDRVRDLDRILSDYRADSELTEVTRTAVGRAVAVSEDLFVVLQKSQELAEATGGAFDVTQGPVIRLWREARKTARVPAAAALHEAAARSGFRKLHLQADRRTVMLDMAGMTLDLGAIGKGYAASEAVEVLTALGVHSALVAVSGDLAFSNAPPGQRGWRINIHSEDTTTTAIPSTLELTNLAVSTAGSSEQHVVIDGRRYSHIIDPSSRMGLQDDLTVTVVARHGLDADGLDTAVSVLGVRRGLALIESRPAVAALIIRRMSRGTTVLPSTRFRKLAAGTLLSAR